MDRCPHCHVAYPPVPQYHVCADKGRWTDAERYTARQIGRRRRPSVQFAPSTRQLSDRGLI